MPADDQLARRAACLGPAYRLFYDEPFEPVRAEGVWLYDKQGNAFLDAYNNVPHAGHCHPEIVEAVARQSATLNIHTRYITDEVLSYSEQLTSTLPDSLTVSMFTCTGSEANDLALRVARACTDATGVIVTAHAYHGNSGEVARVSPAYAAHEGVGEHVECVSIASGFADEVRRAIARLQERGLRPAALLLDPIFASDGIHTLSKAEVVAAAEAVHAAGGLLIADEVQAGFGRTGETFWGFEYYGLQPDLVTIGKPAGNGYPLGATLMRQDLAARFAEKTRYFNTFGGNPVASAAGQAVLTISQRDGLQTNAQTVGERLRSALADMFARHDMPVSIRGRGLFIGAQFADQGRDGAADAHFVVNHLRRHGVLINPTGPDANVLKIRPPMPFSSHNADQLLTTLDAALTALREEPHHD